MAEKREKRQTDGTAEEPQVRKVPEKKKRLRRGVGSEIDGKGKAERPNGRRKAIKVKAEKRKKRSEGTAAERRKTGAGKNRRRSTEVRW